MGGCENRESLDGYDRNTNVVDASRVGLFGSLKLPG